MSRPQHHKAVRLRLSSTALGLGAVLALAGCSAGQSTETDTQVAAVNGANGEANQLAVRDAQLTFPTGESSYYPKGSSAPVQTVLVNQSSETDRLVQVTSPYAGSAKLGGTTDLPGRTALRAYGEPAEGAQPGSQQPAGSQSQSPPADTPSGEREVTITLTGMTEDIRPGLTIPVTFVFEKSGPTTVQVPIGASPEERPDHDSPPGGGH